MIQTKNNVHLGNLEPVMLLALLFLERKFNKLGHSLVVTSTDDGKHKENSLHYVGLAVDIRIRHIKNELEVGELTDSIQSLLSSLDKHFQVILESTHIHIEYDRGI